MPQVLDAEMTNATLRGDPAAMDAAMLESLIETIAILEDPEALKMLKASFGDIHKGNLHDHEDVKSELLTEGASEIE